MTNHMNIHPKRSPVSPRSITLVLLGLLCFGTIGTVSQSAQASTYGVGLANYQGQLINAQGIPYAPGSYDLEIALYDSPVAGNMIWGPIVYDGQAGTGHASRVYVGDQGNFNVRLGDKDTAGRDFLSAMAVATTSSVFLEYRVGDLSTAEPSTPRQQLLSVPYAIQAYNVPQFQNISVSEDNNVGIGVENPVSKLQIDGSMKVSGISQAGRVTGEALASEQGVVQGSFEGDSLVVDGPLHVSGQITPRGPITFLRETSGWVAQGSSYETVVDVLDDPERRWQCYLSGVRMGSPDTDAQSTNCKVEYGGGSWKLTVSTAFNYQTECAAVCIKIR